MLIIPVTRTINWKNPPVLTLMIIFSCIVVFGVFQWDDNQKFHETQFFYFDSGLAGIEVSSYIRYLGDDPEYTKEGQQLSQKAIETYYPKMMQDDGFMKRLITGEIITASETGYNQWIELREKYNTKLQQTVSMSHGYIPAFPKLTALLTHMFLHGGLGHLIGNMIFLWIVGCVLETGCGRVAYLSSYLLSGILAAVLFGVIYSSVTPLIGASGAISGLMGMLTVLYGKKTIRVFYSLGFYFDYIRLKAIFLLPLWIANELFQIFFGGISNVAYVAHIGGLITGAVCGAVLLKIPNVVKQDIFEDVTDDTISPRIETALHHISKLELEEGKTILEDILKQSPENIPALKHLFHIHKQNPSGQRFHDIFAHLLHVLLKEPADTAKALEMYNEYQVISPVPKLPPTLLIRISLACLARGDHLDQAAKIMMFLLKKAPETQGIPTVLLKLSQAYQKKGNHGNQEKCLKIIRTRYPQSHEARMPSRR